QRRTALQIVPGSAAATVNFTPTLPAYGPIQSDTGEITWDAGQRIFTLNAPAARLLLGKVGGKSVAVGDIGFQVGSMGGNEHAYLGLVALDGQPLTSSHQVLLVALDRKSTRLNSSHVSISYAVFCLKKKNKSSYNALTLP